MDFEVNLRERILKPVNEVFDAFADHRQMSRYFIRGASGPIRPGTVEWEYGDVGVKVSIDVLEVEENRKIVLESSALGPRIRTTIDFMPDGPDATVVTVTESKFPLTGRHSTRPGTECRGDPHLVRPESVRAIRHQSADRPPAKAEGIVTAPRVQWQT